MKASDLLKPANREEAELLAKLDAKRLPDHVAIIMDGNGRWAERRHLPRIAGHRAGVKAARGGSRRARSCTCHASRFMHFRSRTGGARRPKSIS